MAYTALSRVRTLEGLILLDFDPTKIRMDPKAQQEYPRFAQLPPPGESNNWATDRTDRISSARTTTS
jgi:hypothetical protein